MCHRHTLVISAANIFLFIHLKTLRQIWYSKQRYPIDYNQSFAEMFSCINLWKNIKMSIILWEISRRRLIRFKYWKCKCSFSCLNKSFSYYQTVTFIVAFKFHWTRVDRITSPLNKSSIRRPSWPYVGSLEKVNICFTSSSIYI